MSTSIDVYKIPDEYKKLNYYNEDHVSYDDEYLIYTLGVFDRVNIITGLFKITFDKHIEGAARGLFDADYLITLHEFESAKTTYFDSYNCDILVQNYAIEKKDYDFIHEGLVDFFNTLEPIIQSEKKLFFSIG